MEPKRTMTNDEVESLEKQAMKRENASREELERKYVTDNSVLLCECCYKQEATEIVEKETGGYSHWDDYVYTVEYRVCKDCLRQEFSE